MTQRKTSCILAAAASLALGSFALAEQPNRADGAGAAGQADGDRQAAQRAADAQQQITKALDQIAADPKTAADKLFILTAAIHNQSEIQLAKEALKRSQNDHVKKMAQQMIQSLQQTHDQIQQTAQALGLQLPSELAQAAVQEVQIIAALPADQADQQYTSHAQADNAQDLSTYQSEAQTAQDPQVRKFAEQQLGNVRQRSDQGSLAAQDMGMPSGENPIKASTGGDKR